MEDFIFCAVISPFVCIFLYYGELMEKPMHFPYDKIR